MTDQAEVRGLRGGRGQGQPAGTGAERVERGRCALAALQHLLSAITSGDLPLQRGGEPDVHDTPATRVCSYAQALPYLSCHVPPILYYSPSILTTSQPTLPLRL